MAYASGTPLKLFLDFSFSVQVLLPAAWTVTAEEAINEVYTDAQVKGHGSLHVLFQNVREGTLLSHQVRVWHTDPLHGDSPFTEQPGQCGEEGDFIHVKIQMVMLLLHVFPQITSKVKEYKAKDCDKTY